MTAFQSIITLIQENEDSIEYDYKGIKDLYVIQGELFQKIINFLKTIEDKSVDKKSLIKKAVKTVLELEEQDLILVKKEQIVVKIIKEIKRDENENRFNGYSEEEIEKLYKEYFDKQAIDKLIKNVSYELFKYLFIRKQVTNDFYEKNIYPLAQSHLSKELVDIEGKNASFRKGFAGYILRINFIPFFSHISDQILESISYRDEYLMNWIKYYNGQVIIKDGKRYEAPSLINNEGQRYNPSALFGAVAIWFKTRDKIDVLKQRLNDIGKNLEKLKIDNISPVTYKDELIQDRQELESFISEANEKIKKLLERKRINKDEELQYDINDEIQELRLDIKADKKDLEELNTRISTIDTISTKRLEEDKSRIIKDIAREERAMKQNIKAYKSLHSAIVKALTSKRKPI